MKQALTVITSRITVDFPLLGVSSIPAKVDTGADSSSVWISDLSIDEGIVKFKLFAPSSPFYTGETIYATDFKKVLIKNSFGHVERRYKVRLQVKIADRLINTYFTLSNRTNNRYPILIGHRTLQGKFLINVAKAKHQIRTLIDTN